MNKFTKICLILSSLLLCVGILFVVVGASFGGTAFFSNLVYKNAFSIHTDSIFSTENDESFTNAGNENSSDDAKAVSQNFSAPEVQNLDIDVSYGEIYLSTSNESKDIQVIAQNMDSTYRANTSDGTLTILSEKKKRHFKFNTLSDFDKYDKNHPILKVILPSDFKFTNSSLDVDAGYIKISTLDVNKLNLSLDAGLCTVDQLQVSSSSTVDIGAGKFELQSGNVKNLKLSCGAGQAIVSSKLEGKTTLNCSVGEILLTTEGNRNDFDYAISCDVGSIDIDEQTYSGLSIAKNIDNHASKSFDLTCNVGHIKVSFT